MLAVGYYRYDALNQSWVNVGPPSVTLAHIQPGAKKQHGNPILGYSWVSVVDGGPTLAQHWVNVSCLTTCTLTQRDTDSMSSER